MTRNCRPRAHRRARARRAASSLRAMVASSYHDALWEAVPEGRAPVMLELRRGFLLERLGRRAAEQPRRRLRVLDVGCGEGHFTAALARAGFEAVGADVAEEPLRRARDLHGGLDLRLLPAAGAWPLQDSSFDAVWAGETVEHVIDTAGWLSEARRVLRSGGELLLSTPAHGRLTMLAPRAVGAPLRSALRSALGPRALLHPPHAGAAARRVRLRAHPGARGRWCPGSSPRAARRCRARPLLALPEARRVLPTAVSGRF